MHLRLLTGLTCLLLPAAADAQSYHNLLADRSLGDWMKTDGQPVNGGWETDADGTLHLAGSGGNIITRIPYENFELWFEFRVPPKGNNGIKYRVRQFDRQWLGCEYQVLDDAAFPRLPRKHLTASLYDVAEPIASDTVLKPEGEFNVGKIEVRGNRIRHWLNGRIMIDECVGSHRWQQNIQNSKFRSREGFGENRSGHIMLTDHNSEVWYRNMFVRRL